MRPLLRDYYLYTIFSVSSEGKKTRQSRNGRKEKVHRPNSKEKDLQAIEVDNVPKSPAKVNQPGTKQQPLSLPGYDEEPKNFDGNTKKVPSEKEPRRSHSRSSSSHKDYQGLDIAKLIKQQAEILQAFKNFPTAVSTMGKEKIVPASTVQSNPVQELFFETRKRKIY